MDKSLKTLLGLDTNQRFEQYLRDRITGTNTFEGESISVINTSWEPVTFQDTHWGFDLSRGALLRALGFSVAASLASIIPMTAAQRGLEVTVDHPDIDVETIYIVETPPTATVSVDHIHQTIEVPRTVTHSVELTTHSDVGRTDADAVNTQNLLDKITELRSQGAHVTLLEVNGRSSDEFGTLATSLGIPNVENDEFALERGFIELGTINHNAQANGISLPPEKLTWVETILTPDQISKINQFAQQYGYSTADEMYNVYKTNPQALPPGVKELIDISLDKQRGTIITLSYTTVEMEQKQITVAIPHINRTPGHTSVTVDHVPLENTEHWFWLPIPILPLKRTVEEIEAEQLVRTLEKIPVDHEAWIKLYPEALHKDGTVGNDAWRWTRKYQHLLRDDHMKFIYRFDYKDAIGHEQTIRVAFVDHVPTPHALKSIAKSLQIASQAQEGSIGERLSLVTVFPSSQSGITNDPYRIGIGIDEQYGIGTLGVAIPLLGVVEIHMDPNATEQEVNSFFGMGRTFAHEVVGHFTDLTSERPKLHEVPGVRNGYHASTPWNSTAAGLYERYARELLSGIGPTWEVHTQGGEIPDAGWNTNGDTRTVEMSIPKIPADPNVVQVHKNGFPTEYSMVGGPLELWAEAVATTVVGELPFSESQVSDPVPAVVAANIPGYKLDRRAQLLVNKHLGGVGGAEEIQFFHTAQAQENWVHTLGGVDADPEFAEIVQDAKSRDLPRDRKLINVLTTVRQRDSDLTTSRLEQPVEPLPMENTGRSL